MASFLKPSRRAEPTSDDEVVVAPPPADEWARPLADAVSRLTGASVASSARPQPLPHGRGPWIFGLPLAHDHPEPAVEPSDAGPAVALGTSAAPPALVARLGTARPDLERELAAIEHNRTHGFATETVQGIVELDRGSTGPDAITCALITDPIDAVPLPDLIGFNLHHANELLDGFAAHHEAIHRLPIDAIPGSGAVPEIVAEDELDRIDRDRYRAEWRWLADHLPTAAAPVLCHGGYQPLAVFGPPAEAWPEHGGPGQGLTVANWSGAVLAEPAFDVAFTLVAFWSAPFFAPNRSERTAIKMIRNTLLNTYKLGYYARRDLDPDRVRFWQAFHALRGIARLEGAYDTPGSPFATVDRGAIPTELGPELRRHFRQLTRVR